jgi:hypothetical protein
MKKNSKVTKNTTEGECRKLFKLECQFVSIAPTEDTIFPIEVGSVAICEKNPRDYRIMKSHGFDCAVLRGSIGCVDDAVSAFKN